MKYYIDNTTNEIFAYELDGSQDSFIKEGLTLVNDTEVSTALEQNEQTRVNALTYAERRLEAYPSLTEQADMAYWDRQNGTTTLDDAISDIKARFPK